MEQTMNDTLRLTKLLFDNTREGIIITDSERNILHVNSAFTKITGYAEKELIGKTPKILQSGLQEAKKYVEMNHALKTDNYWQGELWDRRKNGELFAIFLSISVVRDEEGKVVNYLGILNEITEKKQYLQRIYDLAYYDNLTRLPNRSLFEDRCVQAIKKANREKKLLSVLFLDIDRFSAINNTFGHNIGDELIRKVAVRLKNSLRDVDTISHFSGDKFVILLENLSELEDAGFIAKKVLKIFSRSFQLKNQEIYVTAGIGISLYPNDAISVQALMQNAESAVHKAKEIGKNRYQYYSKELNSRSFEKLLLETSLRGAQQKEELFLVYQPQINAGTNEIFGMEVLVRWRHSELGLVSPGEFIPLAEETGLIIPIGEWIFRTACRQYMKWYNGGNIDAILSINLSAVQFNQENLVELIKTIVEETGFPLERLELEITETAIMDSVEESIHILEELQELGISVAVDDFGTGYSSLNYLHKFPLKKLKIDQSFISDVPNNADDVTIVSAIISLAQNLRLDVIAEGVETEEQLQFLKQKGCKQIQGYYYSPPVSVEKMEELLLQRTIDAPG